MAIDLRPRKAVTIASVAVTVVVALFVITGTWWIASHFREIDEAAIMRNRAISQDTNARIKNVEEVLMVNRAVIQDSNTLIHTIEDRQTKGLADLHKLVGRCKP